MPFDWVSVGVAVLVFLTIMLVMIAGILVWRDGYLRGWRAARLKPPKCLACGYNLSGLEACRCPECGRGHRLEELWRLDEKRRVRHESKIENGNAASVRNADAASMGNQARKR
ncbi:MAG: hypothetical protein ACPGXK_06255 [Phycisphaerae bacterium]